jgi:hypothetical protein
VTKLKHETENTSISVALEDAKGEISDLASEMGEWRDNMDGSGLENTSKYDTVSEAADTLENLESTIDDIEIDEELDKDIEVNWIHPYGRSLGRSWRASHIVSLINAIIEALPEDNEAIGELEDIANEIDGIEFPGMYG